MMELHAVSSTLHEQGPLAAGTGGQCLLRLHAAICHVVAIGRASLATSLLPKLDGCAKVTGAPLGGDCGFFLSCRGDRIERGNLGFVTPWGPKWPARLAQSLPPLSASPRRGVGYRVTRSRARHRAAIPAERQAARLFNLRPWPRRPMRRRAGGANGALAVRGKACTYGRRLVVGGPRARTADDSSAAASETLDEGVVASVHERTNSNRPTSPRPVFPLSFRPRRLHDGVPSATKLRPRAPVRPPCLRHPDAARCSMHGWDHAHARGPNLAAAVGPPR
ncbi:hypothetical protein CDD83_10496 [Cordyceps sp. RAO-2017]|nr:hypothetical protein CDD83_10496 [Cordyceps sp. RAO-2017]